MSSMAKPGFYKGRQISDYEIGVYGERAKTLKRNKELDKAEELLLNLVDATEEKSKATGMGVIPWYYDELAKIYHKQRAYQSEVAILERFSRQKHAPGSIPPKLIARLENARQATGTRTPFLETSSKVEDEILKEFAAWDEERKLQKESDSSDD